MEENLRLINTKFVQQSLVYLGNVICGGELKIDPAKMEAITKWPTPTSVTKVRMFFGAR